MAAKAARRDAAWVDARLCALATLLPGAESCLLSLRAGDLASVLLLDDAQLACRLVELRGALPAGVDVARLAARRPALLLSPTPGDDARASLRLLGEALPASADGLEALLTREPGLLDATSVRCALEELRRLMPHADAAAALTASPGLLHQALPPARRRDPNDEYAL